MDFKTLEVLRNMNIRLAGAVAAVSMVSGCATSQSDRSYFCTLDGTRLDSVYFDRSKNVLVLDDVVINGSFNCKNKESVCFYSSETSFEFSKQGTEAMVTSDDKSWGGYEWRIDYLSGTLFFKTKQEGSERLKSCDPFIG